jgi:hypothetical protein
VSINPEDITISSVLASCFKRSLECVSTDNAIAEHIRQSTIEALSKHAVDVSGADEVAPDTERDPVTTIDTQGEEVPE